MAMSATAAAKRRRAGGILSSPMLQPPHVLQSMPTNRLISTLQNIQQNSMDQSMPFDVPQPQSQPRPQNISTTMNMSNFSNADPNRGFTLQQIITLLDSRLINLEKNVNPDPDSVTPSINSEKIDTLLTGLDFQSKIEESLSKSENRIQESTSSFVEDAITKRVETIQTEIMQTTEEIISQQLGEFNHRYEILATEILNVKNLILELQSYTMSVNKMLVEERMNVFSELTSNQFKTTNDEVKLDSDVVSLTDNDIDTEAAVNVEIEDEEDVETVVEDVEEVIEEENIETDIEEVVEPEVVEPEPVVEVEPEPIVEVEPEPVVEVEPEPVVEVEPEPVVEVEPEPVVEVEPEPIVETNIIEETPRDTSNDNADFVLVSSKSKKGKGGKNQKKKNSMNIEEEISLSI